MGPAGAVYTERLQNRTLLGDKALVDTCATIKTLHMPAAARQENIHQAGKVGRPLHCGPGSRRSHQRFKLGWSQNRTEEEFHREQKVIQRELLFQKSSRPPELDWLWYALRNRGPVQVQVRPPWLSLR